MRRVGTLTSGIVLLGVGLVLTVDTIFHRHWFIKITPFWPIVLVAIGLEVLWAFYVNHRSASSERIRVDFRSISLLALAAVIGVGFATSEKVVSHFEASHSSSVAMQILNSFRDRSIDLPEMQVPVDNQKRIVIRNWRGSIVVTGKPSGPVSVKTQVHAILLQPADPDQAQRQFLQSVSPQVSRGDDLEIVVPQGDMNHQITQIDLVVSVPQNTSIVLDGRTGDQTVSNVTGDVTFSCDAGKISGASIGGSVLVRQTEGQTSLVQVGGSVAVNESSGSVALEDISGMVTVVSDFGDVSLKDISGKSEITCKSGRISADHLIGEAVFNSRLGAIQITRAVAGVTASTNEGSITVDSLIVGNYKLHSDKGVVTIRVPKTASFRFDGFSNRGVVKGPNTTALSDPSGAHVAETFNDGTYLVQVTTGDGAIMVNPK